MSRSRRHPPLFEVLERSDRGKGRAPAVIVAGSHSPPPEPPVVEPEPPEDPSVDATGHEQDWTWEGGRVYRIPSNVLFVAIAVVIGVMIVIWNLAYRIGEADERSKLAPGEAPGEVLDRAASGPRLDDVVPVDPLARARPAAPPEPEPADPEADPRGLIWNEDVDPRVAETNYLVIARMAWQDAQAAAYFLSDSGVPAAAVPAGRGIDMASVKANNRMCEVIALEGVSSDSYSASKSLRERLEAEVLRIGRLWKREGGSDDFSSRYWRKHKG